MEVLAGVFVPSGNFGKPFCNWKNCFGVSGKAKSSQSCSTVLSALTEIIKDRRVEIRRETEESIN